MFYKIFFVFFCSKLKKFYICTQGFGDFSYTQNNEKVFIVTYKLTKLTTDIDAVSCEHLVFNLKFLV